MRRKMMRKCSVGSALLLVISLVILISTYTMIDQFQHSTSGPRKLIPKIDEMFAGRSSGDMLERNGAYNSNVDDQVMREDLKQIREERVYSLQNGCSKLKRKGLVMTGDIDPENLDHVMVDDNYKVLFCYVPKVACTNMKRVFLLLTGKMNTTNPLDIKSNDVHFSLDGYLRYLSSYSAEQVDFRIKNYKKIIFVREPLERVLSAYRNKFMEKSPYFHKRFGRRIIRKFRDGVSNNDVITGDDVKFPEFVQYITNEAIMEQEGLNEHWARYQDLCHPCNIEYDFIGKYETLDEDVDYVLKDLKIDQIIKFPKRGATYKKKRTRDELEKYYGEISPGYLKLLWKNYVYDYMLFDYPYPAILEKYLDEN